MSRFGKIVRGLKSLKSAGAAAPSRRKRAGLAFENLEGRLVLSSFGGGLGGLASVPSFQFGGHGGPGGSSNVLVQDARLVQQAFQTFQSSYLSATAALRLTATTTAGPTAAGLAAFDSSVATAVTTLNGSIATDLSNLTHTGPTLAATIDGETAALQTEIDGAAAGLAGSTNASVISLNREVNTYLRNASGQAARAVLNDTATGTITPTTLQTFNRAVRTANQAFNTVIGDAARASITGGTALSGTAVSAAVTTLQTALTSAIGGLGTSFGSGTSNPTAAVTAELTTLTTDLTGVTAPTASNTASARLFLRTVSRIVIQSEGVIGQALSTAVRNYDNSLL